MGPLMQSIITIAGIALFFLIIIIIHKKNKPMISSESEKEEQAQKVYDALRDIIRSDGKSIIDELSEKIELQEGDSPDGK